MKLIKMKTVKKSDATVGEKLIKMCNRAIVDAQNAKYGLDAVAREAARVGDSHEADEIEDLIGNAEAIAKQILEDTKKIRTAIGV